MHEDAAVPAATLLTRREAVRRAALLLGYAVSAPTLAGVLAGCERARPGSDWQPQTLSREWSEMVATLGEHILPETDTPGARDAGVHEFIDIMLTEYYPPEERDRFLAGLRRVDARARSRHGAGFLELSAEQQLELVRALNEQAFAMEIGDGGATLPVQSPDLEQTQMETGRGTEEGTAASIAVGADEVWEAEDIGEQAFFRTLKELVLVGYYTSEVGATRELRVNPMGVYRSDIPYAEIGRAWS
jgi:gluconate 2-dehydrogenase gamma chain